MYKFKSKLKKEFIGNNKIKNISKEIGITDCFLSSILNGKRNCSKLVAKCLILLLNKQNIEDFFEEIN